MRLTKKTRNRGFTLLEMVVAMGVLAVAALGGAAMIGIGIKRNTSVRMDTTAANVAQTVLEAAAAARAENNATVNIQDCVGNNVAINTATVAGGVGAPVWGATPPAGINTGDIDFTAAAVVGYQANYVMCGAGGVQITYDVRWRVDPVGTADPATGRFFAKLITVAADQDATDQPGSATVYSPPVTLRSVVGN